ncbi:MAG: M28 family peptidase [Flavobacteriales bacterium]|nr:M28 family peptidase [Flavobacteriales bacterium]
MVLLLVAPILLRGQEDSIALRYGTTITAEDLMRHLSIIASDAYEGRETGMRGQKMAAEYLREQFMKMGIAPVPGGEARGVKDGYFLPFELDVDRPGGIVVEVAGSSFRFMDDFFYFSEKVARDTKLQGVTMVAGISPSDSMFQEIPVKGRAVLWVEPSSDRSEGSGGYVPDPAFLQRLSVMARSASERGATALFFLTDQYDGLKENYAHYITSTRMHLSQSKEAERPVPPEGMQTIIAGRGLGEVLLDRAGTSWKKVQKSGRRGSFSDTADVLLELHYTQLRGRSSSEDVLAFIPGSVRPGEVVVVTAHYDHIGMKDGEVYNGADDDGSGTVALLEMAQAFAKAKAEGHGPLRSILFMPVSGEEKGLLGSEYYSEHPVFPLDSTVADLNIDMIGRTDSAHIGTAPYVYVIGSDRLSSELHAINEAANRNYVGLDLDYTYNAADDPNRFYYRSDHYNFAKHGIPSIFYFSGVHADYHGPHDEVDRIRPDLLEERARLVFYTAWALSQRPERITVDKLKEGSTGR